MVQAGAGGVMVGGIFYWHTLGPLVPIEHCLNATAYLSIVADHIHPFMTTVYHQHSDDRVRIIWRKEHESMDPSCLVSAVQAGGGGGVMVWGMFSWHTLYQFSIV